LAISLSYINPRHAHRHGGYCRALRACSERVVVVQVRARERSGAPWTRRGGCATRSESAGGRRRRRSGRGAGRRRRRTRSASERRRWGESARFGRAARSAWLFALAVAEACADRLTPGSPRVSRPPTDLYHCVSPPPSPPLSLCLATVQTGWWAEEAAGRVAWAGTSTSGTK
jgi:hypothetical protein